MATQLEIVEEPEERGPLTIFDLMEADNIAELLDDTKLAEIGSRAIAEYELDKTSRHDWLAKYRRALDLAMQVATEKTWPWPRSANIKFPLLTVAAIQFQARAYPAIVDGSNLVKGRVLGPDPDGRKRDRANRIGQHMTWQLLYRMPGWEEDTDKLLLQLPIVGTVFRKTYYDEIRRTNVSEMVAAEHFVVDYWSKPLESAVRFTHIIPMYPYEAEERFRAGLWLEVPLQQAPERSNDDDGPVDFLEQHRLIDLDEDGYPEPYVVTMTDQGRIARIAACYDADGVTVASDSLDGAVGLTDLRDQLQGGEPPEDLKIVRIERKQYFTKYGFIPAPDGSFYDMGFGMLLDSLSAAVDTTINQMLDAGTLQNTQGGFLGSGVSIKSGAQRFTPGEWKRVDTSGGTLRDNIMPLALPGPSPVLLNLLQLLIGAAKDITSVQDILTGSQESQTAPTTALALIEQGQKVFTGIYKRIHRAFFNELQILFGLNRDYLDEEQYYALNDTPGQIGREDYQDRDLDVLPVSDPTAVNDMQKMARAQVLMGFNGDPLVNQKEIRLRVLEATGQTDVPKLLDVPEPKPPIDDIVKIEAQSDNRQKAKAEVRAKDAATASSLVDTALKATQLGVMQADQAMTQLGIDLAGVSDELARGVMAGLDDQTGEEGDGQSVEQPGGVPEMVGAPGVGGVPPVSEGLPPDADGAMGGGLADEPGLAAQGGADGGIDEPVV